MKKYPLVMLCAVFLFLTGCGNHMKYDPHWKLYLANTGANWEVNQYRYVKDTDVEFSFTIYTAAKSKTPDFTEWTTETSWNQLSSEQAKKQLGMLWRLVPAEKYYFYKLTTPNASWVFAPATLVGVYTTLQNSQDNKRLVKDIIYGSANSAPIFLTTVPLQLTSITTDQSEQSITFTLKPLSSIAS